jgi:hypothetical protein
MIDIINNVVVGIAALMGAFLAALWLGLIIWTFRDIRARSRDLLAQILATLIVAILNLPGLLVYVMVRPRETLAEAYDRSLEEEALLQSIEEQESCPGCGQRADKDWIVCPYCHTKLKKRCRSCGQAINIRWSLCPYCGIGDGSVSMPPSTSTPSASSAAVHQYPPGSALAQAAEAQARQETEE